MFLLSERQLCENKARNPDKPMRTHSSEMAARFLCPHSPINTPACLHDRANIEQTSSKCIQNTHANCSTSARRLLAFIQLARPAMVISMLIRRAGGL